MELKFKTNINCGGCIKSVSGFINEVQSVEEWKVDTDNPEKILTVKGENISASSIIEVVEEAGFDIESIN
jgi:copper chaperone